MQSIPNTGSEESDDVACVTSHSGDHVAGQLTHHALTSSPP
ncbi:hypothetical protein NRB20_60380 [Nocardia sp. RB20]|uniref:Uncharacterized protein n=1 Tax=Nocardia macrotermitis TaxID=2585198 RepID=A0A7K0DDF7_9NOCA|nr:hypothetical protein [Nocardia macrotermitis]